MLEISLKSKEGLSSYFTLFWEKYRVELIDSGVSESQAFQNIARTKDEIFPGGSFDPHNKVFDVVDDGIYVGDLWLLAKDDGEWWIYDIEITEPNRVHGFGRKALQEAEIYAVKNGGKELRLSVFGFNDVAKQLYDSLGYRTTRIQMKKDLI